jgi:holo-[acyl-carrier protein] synthase
VIVGLGHDLCEIDRIEEMVVRWGARFTERVFTDSERAYALPKVSRAQHLAARFAVKEATLKALGVPPGLSWKEMEVVGGGKKAPQLKLSGKAKLAADALKIESFHITITHTGNFASAVVIAEKS